MASRTDTNDGIVAWKNAAVDYVGRRLRYPSDLVVLYVAVAVAVVAVAALPAGSAVRFVVAAPLALFWPGYALVSLLYPASARASNGDGLGTLSRVALAFGTSLAVLPLMLVAVGAVLPLSVTTVLWSVVVLTLATAALAAIRRSRLPAHRRYQPDPRTAIERLTGRASGRRTFAGRMAVLLLAVAVLLAASTAALAIAAPPTDDDFTNFSLTTEDGNGTLQAGGYPGTLVQGEAASLVSAVANEEDAAQNYHVVVQLQRVEDGTVVERGELTRFAERTAVGERWRHPHAVTPTMAGEDLRLTYLLYRDEVPSEPTRENAYRHLHLWIDVESA